MRNSGGLAVFVKSKYVIDKLVKRIFPELQDCIVLRLKCSVFTNLPDVIIMFTYVSPEGSTIYHEREYTNGYNMLMTAYNQYGIYILETCSI